MLAVIELLQQFQRSRDLVSLLLRTINLVSHPHIVRLFRAAEIKLFGYPRHLLRQIISDDPESLEKICVRRLLY